MAAPLVRMILRGQNAQIEFIDSELPEFVTFGGDQKIAIHQLMGGRRILDAMGYSDAPISWAGIFTTGLAVDRARFCDTLRRTGEQCTLTLGPFSYTGIVGKFEADFARGGLYVPYRISLTVAQDNTAFEITAPLISVQSQISADASRGTYLTGLIGDPTLSSQHSGIVSSIDAAVSAMNPMVKGITDAVSTAQSTTSGVIQTLNASTSAILAPISQIAQAQAQAQRLITSAEGAINNAATLGGLVPGNPVAKITGNFAKQVNAATQLPALYEYSSLLGRTSNNLKIAANLGPTSKTIQVGGGTLQQIAAQEYGDASLWPVIAKANNISDPVITGIKTLIIPPAPR